MRVKGGTAFPGPLFLPPCLPACLACKHGELANVGKGPQALPSKASPQVARPNLCTLVKEQLASAA